MYRGKTKLIEIRGQPTILVKPRKENQIVNRNQFDFFNTVVKKPFNMCKQTDVNYHGILLRRLLW